MAIKFTCTCGKKYSSKMENAGKRYKCPHCGESSKIPEHKDARTPSLSPIALESFPPGRSSSGDAAGPKVQPPSPILLDGGEESPGPASDKSSGRRGMFCTWLTAFVLYAVFIGVSYHIMEAFDPSPGLRNDADPELHARKQDLDPSDAQSWPLLQMMGLASAGATEPPSLTTKEIVADAEQSVARFKGATGSGTGFLIGDGIVATNSHVVEYETIDSIEAIFPSAPTELRGPHKVKLLFEDVKRDIAIFSIKGLKLAPLKLAKDYKFERGDDVTIIGSPGLGDGTSLENAISKGVLSTVSSFNGVRRYQLGASVNPGNSGGPVINAKGQVIGMVVSRATQVEAVSFCVPVEDIVSSLESAAALKNAESTNVGNHHSARVAYLRLAPIGTVYAELIKNCSRIVDICLKSSLNRQLFQDQLNEAFELCADKARVIHSQNHQVSRSALEAVLVDDALPPNVRDDLREFWSTCREMYAFLVSPPVNFGTYRAKATRLRDRFDHLSRNLRASFNPSD